jgi:hypothetical protein
MPRTESVMSSAVEGEVARIFERLKTGEFSRRETSPQSGWEVTLPSGRTVTRSTLQTEARALIALGPDAVPYLLPHVMDGNPALRYLAIYALEQITGEKPYLPYFDAADHAENRARAIEVWRTWYEARK